MLVQREDLKAAQEKSQENSAFSNIFQSMHKDEFAKDYIFPAIKANALYEGKYPISTSLSRPLNRCKDGWKSPKKKAPQHLAHGCTGRRQHDQVRFDVTLGSLAPDRKIIAPVREWGMTREEEIAYAKTKGIPVSDAAKKYSIDASVWGRAIECGLLEDASQAPPEDDLRMDGFWLKKHQILRRLSLLQFEAGVPVAAKRQSYVAPGTY